MHAHVQLYIIQINLCVRSFYYKIFLIFILQKLITIKYTFIVTELILDNKNVILYKNKDIK